MSRIRILPGGKRWTMGLLLLVLALTACSRTGDESQSDGGVAVRGQDVGVSKPEPGAEAATKGERE